MIKVLLEKLDNKGGFYNNDKLPPQQIDGMIKLEKLQMIKDKNNNDVQSKVMYLFNINTDINVGDFVNGTQVLATCKYTGISIGALVVFT